MPMDWGLGPYAPHGEPVSPPLHLHGLTELPFVAYTESCQEAARMATQADVRRL